MLALSLSALSALSACSPDRYVPAASVGSPGNPDRQLVGRVNSRGDQLLGRVGEVSYNPEPPQNSGSEGIDYLNTPNLAAADHTTAQPEQSAEQPLYAQAGDEDALPPIDGGYEAASAQQTPAKLPPIDGGYEQADASADGTQPLTIPADGVNIDAGLGVAAGGEAQVQTQPWQQPGGISIAEGLTAQPVVDGIGTENPVVLLPNAYDTPDTDAVTGTVVRRPSATPAKK